MPFYIDVDRKRRVAIARGRGDLTFNERLSVPADVAAHPDFEANFGVVVDVRDTPPDLDADRVIESVRSLVRLRPLLHHRLAVVAPESIATPLEVGAALANAGGVPVQIFADFQAALAWVTPEGV
ncbi:MAG: hypothetical protein QF890_04325 [Myxococcota bacterium]|jgi:hypothetical protein|nr:hypothetical protein [Deltaproteobacteria bacterium]MCP4240105.1 hypothetical protein [bacterium]MDP6076126.1 hypothetical protein [Myxococcota bacterium]MDP6244765.1 hypothetical protein [Myxococcota bacterium]MDP7073526.1 hypothetical protein [Myxococcota bacterium]